MDAKKLIKKVLNEYEECEELTTINECLSGVVLELQKKDKADDHVFSHMLMVLHKVMTAQNEEEFKTWNVAIKNGLSFSFFSTLYDIAKDESWREVLLEIRTIFSGNYLDLALDCVEEAEWHVKDFIEKNKSKQGSEAYKKELDALENDVVETKNDFEEVSVFCLHFNCKPIKPKRPGLRA